MSTNYYMITKDKDFVKKYFPNEYELTDLPYFGYEVHIGKRSIGWKPLFQGHKKAYNSVSEMIDFFKRFDNECMLYDEYNRILSIEQLNEELVKWGEYQTTKYMKYIPGGRLWNGKGGWKKYFTEGTIDDYDIVKPYDHVEYGKFDIDELFISPNYYHDKDDYDFIDEEFS